MPVQYGCILDEHRAVRERVGLFDLSHMGELFVEGPEAGVALAAALVTRPAGARRRARPLLDDLRAPTAGSSTTSSCTGWREERFLVVANATQRGRRRRTRWPSGSPASRRSSTTRSLATGLVAVQGPRAARRADAADRRRPGRPALLRHRRGHGRRHPGARRADRLHRRGRLRGLRGDRPDRRALGRPADRRARPPTASPSAWAPATRCGSRPACRSTATSSTATTNPYEAGLGRVVKLDKPGDFVGRAALEQIAAAGPAKRLVGLVVEGRGIARHGYPVKAAERATGVVTSGTQSPTLGMPIAMAYVAPGDAETGTILAVEIRDAPVSAKVVDLPFYRRPTDRSGSRCPRPARRARRPRRPAAPGGGTPRWSQRPAVHEGPRVGPRRG